MLFFVWLIFRGPGPERAGTREDSGREEEYYEKIIVFAGVGFDVRGFVSIRRFCGRKEHFHNADHL